MMMSTRTRTQMPLATATVGPQSWSDATVNEIKISQAAVEKTDTGQEAGRSFDALPSLRDNCAQQSNTVVHQYVRECRISLVKLRDSFLETNEEVKSLLRGKEALEKKLEHIRKDIALNKMSTEIRSTRPSRERGRDGADDVVEKEFRHLHQLKKALELQLRSVQKQLQVLDQCRKRLSAVIQERNRVLDLLCHAVSSVNGRASRNSGRISRQEKTMTFGGNGTGYTRQINLNVSELLGTGSLPPDGEERNGSNTPPPDPLGPFTPEAAAAIAQAREARQRSQVLRKEIRDAIENTQQLQQAAHRAVNDSLNQKVAETVTLKQHLTVAAGENRHSIHRAQRWYDSTEKALGYTIGPEMQSDLETREKLTRPLVRVYQRHPGTNLPEAQDIIRGAAGLDESLLKTSRNIGLLQMAQGRLQGDIRHKHAGASVDSSIVRMRRRLANHRWVMGSV
ncbi:coiled-coil domain-containing protein 105-like [Lytechinus variegatus]|uniref:coiled-coil domain-containing protein 105-like n=1 Tax=Lytechinus variegatus TaxID=7654 RepID=UPI001BB0E8EB|nr:coiled-coil domain-containing protein 105-like [Lytechinus variegatus]